jgi:hypothetical protein
MRKLQFQRGVEFPSSLLHLPICLKRYELSLLTELGIKWTLNEILIFFIYMNLAFEIAD